MSWMCIVLMSDESPVNSAELTRHYQATWPKGPKLVASEAQENTHAFDVGKASVIIGRMPAPIPDMKVEDPALTLLWPEAKQDVERHRFHWVVVVSGEAGAEIDKARLLTRFTHSLLATHPGALGVSWGSHANLVSSKVFQEMAPAMREGEDPSHIWVFVRCGWRPEGPAAGKSAGMTRGMSDFKLMEIEAQEALEPPSELYDRLQGLAGYLISRGPVIRDGDTVGADENEKIKVVYGPSAFGAAGQVMQLVYGNAAGSSPFAATPAMPSAGAPARGVAAANPFSTVAGPPNNSSWRPPGPGGPAPIAGPQGTGGGSGGWTPPPVPGASGGWPAPGSPAGYSAPVHMGQPAPYATAQTTSVAAIFSLMFGIVSPFVFCICFLSLPTSIIAVVLGHVALGNIKRSGGRLTGRGLAIAGLIIGYIVGIASLAFLLWIFVIAPNFNQGTPSIFDGDDEIELDTMPLDGEGAGGTTGPSGANDNAAPPPVVTQPPGITPVPPVQQPPTPVTPPKNDLPPTPPTENPGANVPGVPPGIPPNSQGGRPFPPIPTPPFPGFPEGIPGGPPRPGQMPSVPNPFAPENPTGNAKTRPSSPGGPQAVDPSTVEASFPNMQWPVKSLAFATDVPRLAVGKLDAAAMVFDVKSGEKVWEKTNLNSLGQAAAIALLPDGKTLIAGGFSGNVLSWNIEDANAEPLTLKGHRQPVTCIDLQREGKFVITGGQDGEVIWQPPTQPDKSRSLSAFRGPVRAIRVGTPATTAWATDGKEAVQIDLRKSASMRTVALGKGAVLSAAISHDAQYVAVSEGSSVNVFETETGKQVAKLKSGMGVLWSVRFTPDGKYLLAGGHGRIHVWDFIKGEQVKELMVGGGLYVQTFAVSADSRWVAAIVESAGQTLYVLRLTDGETN